MVLPKTPAAADAIVGAGAARRIRICTRASPPSLRSRRCRRRRRSDRRSMPSREEAGELQRPVAEPRVLHRGDAAPGRLSSTQYKADPAAEPFTALPASLRLGDTKPDWRAPAAADLTADWKEMQVPGTWETQGPAGFRRRRLVHADGRRPAGRDADGALARPYRQHRRSVGQRSLDVTGTERRAAGRRPAAGGGRGGPPRLSARRAGVMRPGHEHDHRAHPEQPERRRLPRHAGVDVRRGGSDARAAWRELAVPRRATDQRRRAVREAGRARCARGVHGRRRSGRSGRRGAAEDRSRRRPTSCCGLRSSPAR